MVSVVDMMVYRKENLARCVRYMEAMAELHVAADAGVRLFVHDTAPVLGQDKLWTAAILVAMGYGRPVVNERIHARAAIMRLEE